jgi:hypothetical protein
VNKLSRALVRAGGWLLGLGVLMLALPALPAYAATTVPYTDPAAAGSLGLCDNHGHQVTSGSTEDLPLAWTVVSTAAAPTGYRDAKSKATLFAFQPRLGVDPGDWSGGPLTSSSFYSNPAHPMAAFTTGDKRLHEFLQIYPAKWQGFVQLRLFFSGANKVVFSTMYPALNIQVTGTSWKAVNPVTVSCSAGKAVSVETLYLAPSKFPKPSTASSPATSAGGAAPSAGSSTSGGTTAASGTDPVAATSPTGSSTVLVGLLAVIVLGAGLVLVFWLRNRRQTSTQGKGSS